MCLKAKILPLVGAFQKWKSPRNSGLPKLLLPKYKRPDRPNSSKTREVRQLLYIAPSSQRRRHEEKKKELINMSIEHYRTCPWPSISNMNFQHISALQVQDVSRFVGHVEPTFGTFVQELVFSLGICADGAGLLRVGPKLVMDFWLEAFRSWCPCC